MYADSLQLAKLVTSYKFKKLNPPRYTPPVVTKSILNVLISLPVTTKLNVKKVEEIVSVSLNTVNVGIYWVGVMEGVGVTVGVLVGEGVIVGVGVKILKAYFSG